MGLYNCTCVSCLLRTLFVEISLSFQRPSFAFEFSQESIFAKLNLTFGLWRSCTGSTKASTVTMVSMTGPKNSKMSFGLWWNRTGFTTKVWTQKKESQYYIGIIYCLMRRGHWWLFSLKRHHNHSLTNVLLGVLCWSVTSDNRFPRLLLPPKSQPE